MLHGCRLAEPDASRVCFFACRSGVDVVLVGDSVGMVVLGHDDTTEVTMADMVHHCQASARGASRAVLVGDLPFGSYLTPVEACVSRIATCASLHIHMHMHMYM